MKGMCLFLALMFALCGTTLVADSVDRIDDARNVFESIMSAPGGGIPHPLLERARCIVIVPSIQGAGMVYGDRYGVGVATCRNETGWTPPSTIKIAGGSFSRQIFHGTSSLVLLVMSESAAYRLTQSPLVVLEGTATMGPVGPAFVDFCTLGCFDIFAYGWSNNMYIDVPLEGAIIRAADDVNQTIYGTKVSQAEILTGHVPMPPAAVPLVGAVSTYSGGVLEAY